MNSDRLSTALRFAAGAMLLTVFVWSSVLADQIMKVVASDDLGGPKRYLAHVSTDKPIYRSGETVYVRSVVLDASNRRPLADGNSSGSAFVQLKGPKGETVTSAHAVTTDGASGFSWQVPEGQAGGEYRAVVTYPGAGVPPAERKFDVRAYRPPRLKTQIKFLRDGYGPADVVSATLEVTRAERGAPRGARATIVARVDGAEIHRSGAMVSGSGRCEARFPLPEKMERGEGTLSFVIEDGGVVETAAKTIPILLQTVDLAVYPEGGDLVAGLSSRIYLEARTPAKKPADIAGVVEDGRGRQVGSFRTSHEGRGRFTFRPEAGKAYRLRITEPAGIETTFPLPVVKKAGLVIEALKDVYASRDALGLRISGNVEGEVSLTVSRREVELAEAILDRVTEVGKYVAFTLPSSADGVLIVTAWSDGVPMAERLVYRQPAKSVRVTVEPDLERYVPAGKVSLRVRTEDDRGNPLGAVVGLTVTDDSVLEMIETREQAPRLPVMVFLEGEVRELADAAVYLDPENPKAPKALDLLLGTQGWRRFGTVNTGEFLKEHGDAARRVLAMRIVTGNEFAKANWFGGVRQPMPAAPPVMKAPGRVRGAVVRKEKNVRLDAHPEMEPAPVMAAPLPRDQAAGKEMKFADALVAGQKKMKMKRRIGGIAMEEDVAGEFMPTVTVREYAHSLLPGHRAGDRVDFTETLFWHAGIRTDEATGEATVTFDLSDAVTTFRVFADAWTSDGRIGGGKALIESVQPFYAEAKLPLEVTFGDRVLLPLSFVNGTAESLGDLSVDIAAAPGFEVGTFEPVVLGADSRVRRIAGLDVGNLMGEFDFTLDAKAGPYADRVTRAIRVVPRGFPVSIAEGGMLVPDGSLKFTIEIPKNRVPNSVTSALNVYPTPLANLTAALERLIREPHGCFEQTSSTTYPLVMVQQYFLSHQGIDPSLIERSGALLDKGYKRLVSFETESKGYEWFGQSPGHEVLSAYGLLEFSDLAEVYSVDTAMIDRTRSWILSSRDGDGGFKRERRALHTWIEDRDCSNGYITWALLESGESSNSLAPEIALVLKSARESSNRYVTALGANVALRAGDEEAARTLMDRLARSQGEEGFVDGATTSIVGSRGISLQIETTSLAVLAWLQDSAYAGSVERAIRWLAEVCEAGRYGSTQSSVLALKAIIAYDRARSVPKAAGSIQLVVDGIDAGSPITFDEESHGAIVLPDIAEMLEPGTHTVEIRMTGGSEMPASVAVEFFNDLPASSEECFVDLDVSIAESSLTEGDVTEANVKVRNVAKEAIPTPVAIVGIPGGLEVRHDQLKELVKAERIAAYEVRGREVILYWRSLAAEQEVSLPLSLVAEIPGSYTAPANRAYQYYADEFKVWTAPLAVEITAK